MYSKDFIEEVVDYYLEGHSKYETAQFYNINHQSVLNWIRELGYTPRPNAPKGHTKRTLKPRSVKDGRSSHPAYKYWNGMRSRVLSAHKQYCYEHVSICQEWDDFWIFVNDTKDMLHAYENEYSIDRINNDKGYSKDNVRWIPIENQQSNRRCNKWVIL